MSNITSNLESMFHQAQQLHQAGRLAEAETLYRQILQQNSHHAPSLHLLGVMAGQLQNYGMAQQLIRQAIALQPHFPDAYNNLGHALKCLGQAGDALAAFRQAIAQQPDYVDAYINLSLLLQEQDQPEASVAASRKAIELNPRIPIVYNNLGNALGKLGRAHEAIRAYRQAIALQPDFAEAHNNLGATLAETRQLDEAVSAFRQAVAKQPDFTEAYLNLGNVLADLAEPDSAIEAFRHAIAQNPSNAQAHSALLYMLHFHPGYDPQTIAAEHRRWNLHFAKPLSTVIHTHVNTRDPDRRLRIGYVSPDFHEHSIAPMVLPLIAHHDRQQFEVFCYAQVKRPDVMTQRFRAHADHWRNTVGISDQQLALQIRQDQIDILIDLAGHTAGNRLLVFAQKPAPVQVARQGYPNATGLETIDYRMSDAYTDPPGLSDELHSEKIIRLAETNWIYLPLEEAQAITVPPLDPAAPITFGCFNTFAKVTEPMLRLWADILGTVPQSRLLLKARVLATPSVQRRVRDLFAARGITADRLELLAWTASTAEHLALYPRLAIALDPFPCHGTTTTCEALWMGVPVITLAGQTHVSRVGVSLLTNLGTPELIAQTPEQYIRIATDLAHDRPSLARLRATLRQKLQSSPIMDHARFTRNVETQYRTIWRSWCQQVRLGNSRSYLLNETVQANQLLKSGLEHHRDGRMAEAEAVYQQVLHDNPQQGDALYGLGLLAAQTQRYEWAVSLFRQAIAVIPAFPKAYVNLGASLRKLGQFDAAIAAYRQAISQNPTYTKAYCNLGATQREQGQPEQAVTTYRQAMALGPTAEICCNLGLALADLGRHKEAMAAFHQAMELDASCVEALCGLGTLLRKTGQVDDAIATFRRAVALRPDYTPASDFLAHALKELGQRE